MDRLLIMLMMLYFVSPEDTNTAVGSAAIAPKLTPRTVAAAAAAAAPAAPPLLTSSGARASENAGGRGGGGGGGSGNGELLLVVDKNAADDDDNGAPSPASVNLDATPTASAGTAADTVGEKGTDAAAAAAAAAGVGGFENAPAPPTPPSPAVLAPSSASPPTPPRPAARGRAKLLGERVYAVFSGLFEGFRLHDLYVPDKGGVFVCTEVGILSPAGCRRREMAPPFLRVWALCCIWYLFVVCCFCLVLGCIRAGGGGPAFDFWDDVCTHGRIFFSRVCVSRACKARTRNLNLVRSVSPMYMYTYFSLWRALSRCHAPSSCREERAAHEPPSPSRFFSRVYGSALCLIAPKVGTKPTVLFPHVVVYFASCSDIRAVGFVFFFLFFVNRC